MPPFYQFDQYRSPYANSIADLILRQGDAPANALMTAANARAQSMQQSGQAWGQAAQNIGQSVSGIAQQMSDPRRQIEAIQLSGLQRQKTGSVALSNAIRQNLKPDGTIDHNAVATQVSAAGYPEQAESWLKTAASNAESIEKLAESAKSHTRMELATYGDLAFRAQTPQDFISSLGLLASRGLIDEKTAHQTVDQAQSSGPDGWQQFKAKLLPFSPEYKKQQDELNKPVTVGEGGIVGVPATGQVLLKGGDKPPTEAELALRAAGGDPAKAMGILKPAAQKTEWDAWMQSYPRTLGAANWDALSAEQQQHGFSAFTKAKQDPALVALTKESTALRESLMRIQIGQQPTTDDAKGIAQQIIDHKMAPSQLALFGGFGAAGSAFKRQVGLEAIKLDPSFNWEQAEGDYQFSKSAGFQSSVRYMDAVVESMPRLEETAKRLGNGQFRGLNDLVNAGKQAFNSTDLKAFKTDALLVGDEVAKILQGGGTGSGTSDAKLKQASELISASDNVPAIAAAIKEIQFLIANRRSTLTRGTYMSGTSAPAKPPTIDGVFQRDANGNIKKVGG